MSPAPDKNTRHMKIDLFRVTKLRNKLSAAVAAYLFVDGGKGDAKLGEVDEPPHRLEGTRLCAKKNLDRVGVSVKIDQCQGQEQGVYEKWWSVVAVRRKKKGVCLPRPAVGR